MHPIFNQIQIMTKQQCNLKCSFCPNKYIEQTGYEMSNSLFSKIINELASIDYNKRITLYLMNEPFLDNRLKDMVKEVREKCPKARINVSTNGILPTIQDMNELFVNGLSDADISCYSNETFNKWKDYNNKIVLNRIDPNWPHLNNRAGNVPEYGNPSRIGNGYCERPFVQMYINAWGEAVLCCSDYKREAIMGDVNKSSLIEIWNNEKYNEYRRMLNTGKRNLILCERCNF